MAFHEGLRTLPHRVLVFGPVLAQVRWSQPVLVHALSGVSKEPCPHHLTEPTNPISRAGDRSAPRRPTSGLLVLNILK